MITVQSLHVYPVKSCRGIDVDRTSLNQWGMLHDRAWVLSDPDGIMITQRTKPVLSQIYTGIDSGTLILSAPGHDDFCIAIDHIGNAAEVDVWTNICHGIDQGDAVASWIKMVSNIDARLLRIDPAYFREVEIPEKFAHLDGASTAFADGYPMLIIAQESLDDLNARLDEAVPMNRFRPNIVVSGCEPYAEDTWQHIQIGDVQFDVVKACERCVMTMVNQDTSKISKEPLKTIAKYRPGVTFGMNLIHRTLKDIKVGDELHIAADSVK
ncbi:MAG: MOSC domain-containing protein [Planctomycetes bacterium]|nr:MOSC domain-containing protein [Planctomycetota bacterium]